MTHGKPAEGVTVRNFSIPDDLFAAAKDKATREGVPLAGVVRRKLAEYLEEPVMPSPPPSRTG